MNRRNISCLFVLAVSLFVCYCSVLSLGSRDWTTCDVHSSAGREQSIFGPFKLGDTKYTVTMDEIVVPSLHSGNVGVRQNLQTSLARVRVQDDARNTLWKRTFPQNAASETRIVGTAYKILGGTGEGIVLEFGTLSPNRVTAGRFIVFTKRNERLEQIGPEVKFYGSMEHIPDAGKNQRRLVSGDEIRYQYWVGTYYLLRGVQVNLRAGTIVPLCASQCTLSVMAGPSPSPKDVSVRFFDCPDGEAHEVRVKEQSKIEFLDAYVEDVALIDAPPSSGKGPWLHVRIDGKEGWVSNAEVERIGLHPNRRADD